MTTIRSFEQKERKLQDKITRQPQKPEHYLRLGQLYFLNSDYARADEIYRRGLQIAPADIPLLFNYAVCREAQQDLEGARKLFLEILTIDPNDTLAQEHLDRLTDF